MLQPIPIQFGSLNGIVYDFPLVGDILPMHEHTPETIHISIIARGSFRAHGVGWDMVANCGDVLDWEPYHPHEFIALESNSRLVNIIKTSTNGS
jgi:hypothetical protein